jgi:hypothetical protein
VSAEIAAEQEATATNRVARLDVVAKRFAASWRNVAVGICISLLTAETVLRVTRRERLQGDRSRRDRVSEGPFLRR